MEKVPTCHTFKWLYYLCLPGACVYNSSCKEIMSHFDVLCVLARVCVCEYMHEYVSHAPLSSPLGFEFRCPSFQLLYCTLNPVNLLLFTLSPSSCSLCLYLSLTHTLMLIYSPSVSYFLSPSPSSSLQYISLSHALMLSCVLSLFSHNPSSISLYNCASVYLPLQIKTFSDSDRLKLYKVQTDTQGLSVVSLSPLVYRFAARERDRRRERRRQEEVWHERERKACWRFVYI